MVPHVQMSTNCWLGCLLFAIIFFSIHQQPILQLVGDCTSSIVSLGDLPSQIESSSTIQIRISNWDDDFDTNPIPS